MIQEHGEDKEDKVVRKRVHKARQQKNKFLKNTRAEEEKLKDEGKSCLEALHEEFGEEDAQRRFQHVRKKRRTRQELEPTKEQK